jgi:hypothetical protein
MDPSLFDGFGLHLQEPIPIMNLEPLTDAIALALRSDVMLIVSMVLICSASLLGTAARHRALRPEFQWGQALLTRIQIENDYEKRARAATSLVSVTLIGSVGAAALFLSGHAPAPFLAIAPPALAIAIAALLVVRTCRASGPRAVLKERGSRLIASSLFAEVSLALAVVVTVIVVIHTEGLTAVSILEIAAISFASRLAMRLTPWPAGIGIADAALLIPLTWIGVPIHVALSAILIWRASSLLAVTATLILTRSSLDAPRNFTGKHSADLGRALHRALFMAISLLPGFARDAVRRKVFNRLFAHSQDPWNYQTSNYEARKREALLAAIPPHMNGLAEVGCAEGHNLLTLARMRPDITLFGLDISETALAIATKRADGLRNIHFLSPGDPNNFAMLRVLGIDCVVLSEVLYYMGHQQSMRRNLAQLRTVMRPGCHVVMLHGASDAQVLHHRAMRALNLSVVSETRVDDPIRPFVLTVARARPTEPIRPERDLSHSRN